MKKDEALKKLDRIIDDGKNVVGELNELSSYKTPARTGENEKIIYYGLSALLEAIVRECARVVKDDDFPAFIEVLEDSEFQFISNLGKLGIKLKDFNPDFATSADVRMQNLLRLANETVVATEMCATLHQSILQMPTHGFINSKTKLALFKVKQLLNFCVKMAYGEILRLARTNAEAENYSILETLYRWQETEVSSEYFRRVILNFFNNSDLVIELPLTKEANVTRAALADLTSPAEMPLTTVAVGVYERITSVCGFEEVELDTSWDFVEYTY